MTDFWVDISDEDHQPLRIVNGLLGRLVASIPFEAAGDVSEVSLGSRYL